jgi:hypothetical protein
MRSSPPTTTKKSLSLAFIIIIFHLFVPLPCVLLSFSILPSESSSHHFTTTMSTTTTTNNVVVKIALIAGGERTKVVDEAEARRIVSGFEATLVETRRRFCSNNNSKKKNKNRVVVGVVVVVVVHKLDLSCRVWTPVAMENVLRPFLVQNNIAKSVEILKCDDMIASLPTDEGLATLSTLAEIFGNNNNNGKDNSESSSGTGRHSRCVLQEVNFNDNALGTRGLQRLAPILSLPTVTRIYLQNCGISGEAAAETLVQCFLTSSCAPPAGRRRAPLTHVALGLNQMGERGATALGTILANDGSKLEYLSYKGSRPLRNGTHGLLQGLASADTSRLRHLDLNDTDLTTSLELLDQILRHSPQLSSLILRDGALSQAGLRMVIEALQHSQARLQRLDLGAMFGNDDDDDSSSDSDDDDKDSTKFVPVAIELGRYLATLWSTLEILVLGDTEWHNAGILALIAASGALFGGGVDNVAGGGAGGGLRILNLEACCLSGSDVLHVLCHNPIPTLRELVLVDNPDLTSSAALRMLQNDVYSTDIVKIDDDLEEEEQQDEDEDEQEQNENNGGDDDDDDDVNALAAELSQGAHIIAD